MRPRKLIKKPRRAYRRRKAIALVELAVCLPLLVFVLLATLEVCSMLHLKQNLTLTAYEGARIGSVPGTSKASVELQCKHLLDDRDIKSYDIEVIPNPNVLSPGDTIRVTVSAQCAANTVIGGVFYQGKTIRESVVLKAQ